MRSFILLVVGFLIFLSTSVYAQRYSEQLCHQENFTCFKIPSGETWKSLFPNEIQRETIMRINRMNVELQPGMTIAIPETLENMDYMHFSPMEPQINPTGKKTLIIDPKVLAFAAYDENGNLVHWGPVAMGKDWCPDTQSACRTAVGTFSVYRAGSSECISTKFPLPDGGAPMPYCMFFKGGYAIHASTDVPGYHASHGCVRVFYEDAEWLNKHFVEKGTTVIVKPYKTYNLENNAF